LVTEEKRRIATGELLEQGAINATTDIPNLCQSSAIDDRGMRAYDFLTQGSNSQMRIRAGIPAPVASGSFRSLGLSVGRPRPHAFVRATLAFV
jgi:hypothetical protein